MIRALFGRTPQQMLDMAIDRAAKLCAEAEGHRVEAGCYLALLIDVDAATDWWRYASLKQKHFDAHADFELLRAEADKALDVVEKLHGH